MIRQALLVPQGARLQETRGGAGTRPAQVSRAALAQGWTLLSRKRCDLELSFLREGQGWSCLRKPGACTGRGTWKAPPGFCAALASAGRSYNSATVWQVESQAVEPTGLPIG